jgi:hypothetical protein
MSARYVAVGWLPFKLAYDAVLVGTVGVYLVGYQWVGEHLASATLPIDAPTLAMKAYGSATFLLVTLVLCIRPLGEGRVIDGCITCPWHGFQYRLEDGCAPPPYTEKLATYRLRLHDGIVLLDPRPNPPGTKVPPLVVA